MSSRLQVHSAISTAWLSVGTVKEILDVTGGAPLDKDDSHELLPLLRLLYVACQSDYKLCGDENAPSLRGCTDLDSVPSKLF